MRWHTRLDIALKQSIGNCLLSKFGKGHLLKGPKDASEMLHSKPLVGVFTLSLDNFERFQNINDIVDSSSFDSQLGGGIVNDNDVVIVLRKGLNKVFTKDTEGFRLARIILFGRSGSDGCQGVDLVVVVVWWRY